MEDKQAANVKPSPDSKEVSVAESLEGTQIFSNSLAASNDYTEPEVNKDQHEDLTDINQDDEESERVTSVGWPHVEQETEVSPAISREQTPDPDSDGASLYTDSTPGSPDSDADYTSKQLPSLATDRAVKKLKLDTAGNTASETAPDATSTRPFVDDQNTANSHRILDTLITKTSYTKRVSSKSIDRLWANLDRPALQSLLLLFEMSMGKTIERFEGGDDNDPKVAECQRILTENWMSERLPKSFLTRLNVTKLPPLRSLISRIKGIRNDDFDPLNIDQVTQRKGAFESMLSAEMKQLASLEAYLKSLEDVFNSDSEYLRDFKKTAAAQETHIHQEKEKYEKQLNLQHSSSPPPEIKLRKSDTEILDPDALTRPRFDPNTDPDVKNLLGKINEKIVKNNLPMPQLLKLCDDLDVIQGQLYSKQVNQEFSASGSKTT